MVSAEDHKPRIMPAIGPPIPGRNAPGDVPRVIHQTSSDNHQVDPRRHQQLKPVPALPIKPIDLPINTNPRLEAQKIRAPTSPLNSTPTHIDWAQMPPSPPLTAASSMSTARMWSVSKLFSSFTQDPISPRTFFVACQHRTEVELSITVRSLTLFTILPFPTYILVLMTDAWRHA